MNLDKIKTKDEFFEFADIQYQRTLKLVAIWQNPKEPVKRIIKAHVLWLIMMRRMEAIIIKTTEMQQMKTNINLKPGGVIVNNIEKI